MQPLTIWGVLYLCQYRLRRLFIMFVRVAQLFVPVALCAAAFPAIASSDAGRAPVSGERYASIQPVRLDTDHPLYWTASSEYYVAPDSSVQRTSGGAHRRRVMISGWHPYEGFEDAVAQEQANAARHH